MGERLALELPNDGPHVSQATAALRVADIAGAQTCLDSGVDLLEDRAGAGLLDGFAEAAKGVSKTIAYERLLVGRMLLKNFFTQIGFAECLLPIGAVVDRGAICGAAKAIFDRSKPGEREGQ